MPEVNLVSRTLNQFQHQTELAIQVNTSGLSFCIYTPVDKTIRAFRHYKLSNALVLDDILKFTREILEKDELISLPHQKTKVIFTSRKSTLVPDEFFKPDILKKLLEFNQPLSDLDEIHFNSIDFCNTKHVFTVPTYFASIIVNKFNKTVFYNQATSLLLILNELATTDPGHSVIINLNDDFFDIAIMKDGKLNFYNNFLFVNSTDLLYFILYVCRQLGIDKDKAGFYLTGEKCTKKELTGEVHHYLKDIKLLDQLPGIQFTPVTQGLELSRFAALINLIKCGL
jgi:hypothetical protein